MQILGKKRGGRGGRAFVVAACIGAAGCGTTHSTTVDYDYGDGDMQKAIEGHWTGTLTRPDGTSTSLDLTLARDVTGAELQNSTVSPQCGTRTFAHPLCAAMSELALTGALISDDRDLDGTVTGSFMMYYRFAAGGTLHLTATSTTTLDVIYDSGALRSGTLTDKDRVKLGDFSLTRSP
jgi:hypothetical protein